MIEFLPLIFVRVPIYQNLIVHITCELHCFTTTKQKPLPYPGFEKSCYKLGGWNFAHPREFDTHGSVHHRLLSRNTNKMQLCNRIYYSKVFLKAQHVLSDTPLIIRSCKLYMQPLVYMPIWWPAVAKAEWEMDPFPTHPWQRPITIWAYKSEAAYTV